MCKQHKPPWGSSTLSVMGGNTHQCTLHLCFVIAACSYRDEVRQGGHHHGSKARRVSLQVWSLSSHSGGSGG